MLKNKSLKRILLSIGISCLTTVSVCACFLFDSFGWFMDFNENEADGDEFLAINYGYGNNISSFNNGKDFEEEMLNILANQEAEYEDVFNPGDVIYYTFICRINNGDINESTTKDIGITFMMNAGSLESAIADESGFYKEFVTNCEIEANSAKLALLNYEEDELGEVTYTIQKYKVNESDEEATGLFYDSTTTPSFTNTGIEHLYNNEIDDFNYSLQITIPSDDDVSYPLSGEENTDIYFLIVVPIWYHDTEVNQNREMDCRLQISGCIIDTSL